MERTIKEASVEGVRMRRKPAKHAVYAVKMTWSDGQVNVVSRRYSEFYELMRNLVEVFPVEAGKRSRERIIPTLQASRINFLGNNVMKKLDSVSSFIKKLFLLPQEISQSQIVLDFFTPTQEDFKSSRRSTKKRKKPKKSNASSKLKAVKELSITGPVNFEEYYVIEDLKKQFKNGLDLKKGQVVEVIEKSETGWWLVSLEGEHGWVPASYLSNEEESSNAQIKYKPGYGEIYVSTKKYKAEQPDELSFDVGVHLQIIEKNHDGWWKALYCGREGLVPCTYLKLVGHIKKQPTPSKAESGETPYDKNQPEETKDERQDTSQDTSINATPIVRKQSRKNWSGNINDGILKKLRDSTLPSPEENKETLRKKKQPVKPRVHLDLRTSNEGGWVPQKIEKTKIPRERRKTSYDFSVLKPNPNNAVKKHASFSNTFLKSKNNKENDHHNSEIDLSPQNITINKELPATTIKLQSVSGANKNSEEIATQNTQHLVTSLPAPQPTVSTSDSTEHSNQNALKNDTTTQPHENTHSVLTRKRGIMALKYKRKVFSSKMPLQMSEELPDIRRIQMQRPRSSSCPDLAEAALRLRQAGIFNTLTEDKVGENQETKNTLVEDKASGDQKTKCTSFEDKTSEDQKTKNALAEDKVNEDQEITQSLWTTDSEDELNQLSEEPSSSSSEENLVTFQDLEAKTRFSRNDALYSSDSGVCSPGLSPRVSELSNVYIAIENFKGSKEDGEIDLRKDQEVVVLEKTPGGWWYVEAEERGWAPSNFLEQLSRDSDSEEETEVFTYNNFHQEKEIDFVHQNSNSDNVSCIAISDFKGSKADGEVDLSENESVRVLEKTSGGWWLVEGRHGRGWAPSNFLEETSGTQESVDVPKKTSQSPIVGDYHTECREIHDLKSLQLTKGSRFEVLDAQKDGHLVLVRIPSKVAWIPVTSFVHETSLPQCKLESIS